LKELTSGKRDTVEQFNEDSEWSEKICKRLWK
jgi:hypothetical protein